MGILVTGVYRGKTRSFHVDTTELPPLSVADDATFDRWIALPEWDHRTLDEFAASGGARVAPAEFGAYPLAPRGGTGESRRSPPEPPAWQDTGTRVR